MRETSKFYNFYNFNLKVEQPNLTKNELSVKDFANVDVYSSEIKKVGGFASLTNNLFYGNDFLNYDEIKSFTYITAYDYYDSENLVYKTIYFCLDKNFSLYKLKTHENDYTLIDLNISFSEYPKIFTSAGKIYFYQKGEKFICFEGDLDGIIISNFADFESYKNYYDNSFFILNSEPYKVFYTEKTDIENLSDDSSIYQEILGESSSGKLLKLVSLKNSLYAVSQYAISKVVSSGDEFYLLSNCYLKSKIDEDTIFEINDYLMFFAGGKCYLFDGNEFKEIFSSETSLISPSEKIKSVVFDNKYYALAKLNGSVNNSILEFDIGKNKVKIYSFGNVVDLYVIKSISCYKLAIVDEKESSFDESVCEMENVTSVVTQPLDIVNESETDNVASDDIINELNNVTSDETQVVTGGEIANETSDESNSETGDETENVTSDKLGDETSDETNSETADETNSEIEREYNLLEFSDSCEFCGSGFVKFNTICFDDNISKTISDIKIISSGEFTLKISSEHSAKIIDVSENFMVRNLGLSGYSFDIEIFSETEFCLKAIVFKVQTITEQL